LTGLRERRARLSGLLRTARSAEFTALSLLERLAEVRLGLTGELRHDLRTVDEEEEGAGLVGDGAGQQRLAAARRAEHEDTTRRLDADGLEERRVAQRQLDELADLRELLAAAADVVIADVVHRLFVLAVDRVALAVDDGVRRDDAARLRVGLNDLELDLAHAALAGEEVALVDRAVGLHEVRLEEDLEEVAGDALDCVIDGQDVDALAVLDVLAGVHGAVAGGGSERLCQRGADARWSRLGSDELGSFVGRWLRWMAATHTMSPRRTRRLLRTTRLRRTLCASHVSSATTMQTVSWRRLPCCRETEGQPPNGAFVGAGKQARGRERAEPDSLRTLRMTVLPRKRFLRLRGQIQQRQQTGCASWAASKGGQPQCRNTRRRQQLTAPPSLLC
jgi:hypothetical protein